MKHWLKRVVSFVLLLVLESVIQRVLIAPLFA